MKETMFYIHNIISHSRYEIKYLDNPFENEYDMIRNETTDIAFDFRQIFAMYQSPWLLSSTSIFACNPLYN